MKKYFLPLLLLFVSFGFFSCKEIQPVTIGGVENPEMKKLSKEGIEFNFGMKIKNPNNVGVTVFPSTFELSVNGIDVGTVKLNKKVRIKANSDDTPIFYIKSDFSKISMTDIMNVLTTAISKRADVHIKGNVRVGKWYYKKRFPVELQKNINLSK